MVHNYQRRFFYLFSTIELGLIGLSFFAAYYFRYNEFSLALFQFEKQFQVLFAINLLAWFYLSHSFNLHAFKKGSSFEEESWEIIQTTVVCLMMAALPAFFIREHPVSRVFFVLFWIIEVSSLILFRLFLRYALKYIGSYGYRFRQFWSSGGMRVRPSY